MWGCDYLPIGVSWRGGFFPGSFGHLLIWVLVILLLAFLAIRIFKSQTHNSPGSSPGSYRFPGNIKDAFCQRRDLSGGIR